MRHSLVVLLVVCAFVCGPGCTCANPTNGQGPGTPQADVLLERSMDDLRALLRTTSSGEPVRIPRARYVGDGGIKLSDRSGLTVMCEPGTEILVRDPHSYVLLLEHCEDITIQGGLWRHVEPLEEYICHGPVVAMHGSRGVRIEDAVLDGCGAIGVSAGTSEAITIERCIVRNNSFTAFYLESCDGFKIFDTISHDNGNLISAYRTSGLELSGNEIHRNGGHFRAPGPAGPRWGTDETSW